MPDEKLTRIESAWVEIPGEFHWRCRAFQQARLVIEESGEARLELQCKICHETNEYPLSFPGIDWSKVDTDA